MCAEQHVETFTEFDHIFMKRALELAALGEQQGEVPVGAVIVCDGKIVGEGFNQPILAQDPTAHAEVVALRQAAKHLQNYRLEGCTLYVTLEPCTMCVGAIIHARLARVIFAAAEPRAGSLVSARRQMESGYYNHYFPYTGGLLSDESSAMLTRFFRLRRKKNSLSTDSDTHFVGQAGIGGEQ